MSLFRKPKKNIQRRVFSANDDDEDGNFREKMEIDSDIQIPNPPPAPRIKKPDKKEKLQQNKQTLLSFGDEEEGEVFQVKKSSQSKKIMKLLDKERRKKEKSIKNPAEIKVESEFETNSEAQNLKESSNKPSNLLMENIQILNGRAALCAGKNDISDSDDEENQTRQPVHKFSRSENQNSTGSRVDNFKVILESGQIPDAAMIHAARKKRQRARELGGGVNQDFIPMSENDSNENKNDKDNGKGRLVRERDEDFSDEERIDMNVNLKAKEMDSRREQFFASQGQESEHDTDKEMEEWENQQIRKGVTGAQLMAASQESMYGQLADIKNEFIPEVIHEPGALRTPESIVGKLKERLNLVKASLSTHETDLNKVISERDELEKDLYMKEERAPKCGEKFRFYQELRGYVTDLVECLDEKISDIYSIEQRALDLMASQAEKLIERRRQDVRDQAEELSSQQRPGLKPPEDEKKIRRAAEREGRRNRRRRLRETENEKFSQIQKNSHFDGMSSDDEISDLDKLNYEKCVETLQNEKNQIFQDVVDDFCDIKKILEHFNNWKKYDYESYNEAYVSLIIPKILGPFLRLELIFWNPLKEISDFEKQEFYKEIMNYGADPKLDLKGLKNDSDVLLVPNVIEKIFIPKLTLVVENIWDPLSTSENLRLISIISKFIRKYPTLAPDSKNLTSLFNQIIEKFKISIENDVFIPIFRKTPTVGNFDSKSSNPFFQRQFNSALKLLKNICSWSSLINDKILKNLALTLILNRYLLSAVNVCNLIDGVSKLNLISHSIPRIWLNGDTKELLPFNNCVMKFGGHLDKENPLHLESIEIVSGILKTLRCNT